MSITDRNTGSSTLKVLPLSPRWHVSPSQGYPSIKFAGTHLYTWVERGTVRVKCLTQEHNIMSLPGLEPGLLDPETNALTSIHAFVLTSYTSYPVVFGQQFERSTYVCKRLVFKTILFFFFFCSFLKVCMI